MKRILITGANGFIGRNLKESLSCEYDIFAPTRLELNLLDGKQVETYLKKNNFDIVVHAANCNDFKNKNISGYDVLKQNLTMFFNLERCQIYYEKMLYFGSGAEYDMENYIPNMNEDYFGMHIPKDDYGLSKYIMAKTSLQNNNIYDLVLFGVYGKYEEWERRFISSNIYNLLTGKPMTINQNRKFDYLFVEDLVAIVRWFIEEKPMQKRYNVCTGNPIDLLSIAKTINTISTKENEIRIFNKGMGIEYSGDNSRLLHEMGDFTFTELEIGVKRLWDFFLDNILEIQLEGE